MLRDGGRRRAGGLRPPAHPAAPRRAAALALLAAVAAGATGCRLFAPPQPVHVANPGSPCDRLRRSLPGFFGATVFDDADPGATARSVPWCFPAVAGRGVLGHNLRLHLPRPGPVTLALTDVNPPTLFALQTIDGDCAADNTGKSYVNRGVADAWTLTLAAGDHCFSLYKAEHRDEDVFFTFSVTRP